ncbi:MAG: hypothetical protein ACI4QD_00885 [Kiritimatiellia bacterium]
MNHYRAPHRNNQPAPQKHFAPTKPPTYLKGNYAEDIKALRIKGTFKNAQTREPEPKDETGVFITYLVLALQNLSDILGNACDLSGLGSKSAVQSELNKCQRYNELASFLWTHRVSDPAADYRKDLVQKTQWLVLKLWELRNYFVHEGGKDKDQTLPRALIVDREFYRFVEGELYGNAVARAQSDGKSLDKLGKRLFSPRDYQSGQYDFTRRGIIYLICLALFKHDAEEFLQQFGDFRLPPTKRQEESGEYVVSDEKRLSTLKKKAAGNRGVIDAFTYYSMPQRRTDISATDPNYSNFNNILLYLNKVPMPAYDYLALEDEAEKLRKEAAASTESDKNKAFKYLLQPRRKERFLPLALGYLEDFHGLKDVLKFKRLDITPRADRKRYFWGPIPAGTLNEFGQEISDANGMDRHYILTGGKAYFKWEPTRHYGEIHISALCGSIGEDELCRLMLVLLDKSVPQRLTPGEALKRYLTAYHQILEQMLNAKSTEELSLDDANFREAFKVLSGKGDDALKPEVFVEEMKPFLSPHVTRFFVGKDLRPSVEELRQRLLHRLEVEKGKAEDFLLKMKKLEQWRALSVEQRQEKGFPECTTKELNYPPRSCRLSDAALVHWVFKYLNGYLSDEHKFRQLPRGQRHRGGVTDFEYQLVQRAIGNFRKDPEEFWKLPKRKAELEEACEELKKRVSELHEVEKKRNKGKLDRNGKPLRTEASLALLAQAAAELYADACRTSCDYWQGEATEEDRENLEFVCRRNGVPVGLPLNRKALVKTVLGIDLAKWRNAFNYEEGCPYRGRELKEAQNLEVHQVPIPNGFALRCVKNPEEFRFNAQFRAFEPYPKGEMALRKYYDVAPLIDLVKNRKQAKMDAKEAPQQVGIEQRGGLPPVGGEYGKQPPQKVDFSIREVNKAIFAIQTAERRDKVLLACAKAYWERYLATFDAAGKSGLVIGFEDAADIGVFYRQPHDEVIDGVTVRLNPNDRARPAYQTICRHIKELVKLTKPFDGGVYSFYDLNTTLRDLQRKESSRRLETLPRIISFDRTINIGVGENLSRDQRIVEWKKNVESFYHKKVTTDELELLSALRNRLCHPTKDSVGLLDIPYNEAVALLDRIGVR